jgi:hypothetical protein
VPLNDIDSAEEAALFKAQELSKKMTTKLRHAALDAAWPSMIVSNMTVRVKDTQLVIDYPEDLQEEINDLEYGTGPVPPVSVIRTFLNRTDEYISDIFGKDLIDELISEDVF